MTDQQTKIERRSGEDRRNQPFDIVEKPAHYNVHPSGVETIDVVRRFPFAIGNAVKYIMRAPYKGTREQDYRKALWYLNDYIEHHEELSQTRRTLIDDYALIERVVRNDVLPEVLNEVMHWYFSKDRLQAGRDALKAYIEREFSGAQT